MGAGCGRSAAGRESNAPSRAELGMPGHVLAWEGNVLRTPAAARERARCVIWSSQKQSITFSRPPPPSHPWEEGVHAYYFTEPWYAYYFPEPYGNL